MESDIQAKQWRKLDVNCCGEISEILTRLSYDSAAGYVFQWTNFACFYQESLKPKYVESRWVQLNKNVEADLPCQLELISKSLEAFNALTITDGHVRVTFKEEEHGANCEWIFECSALSINAIHQNLFKDCLGVMNYLWQANEHLTQIIKSKDAELRELYENGATYESLEVKQTKPFNQIDSLDLTNVMDHISSPRFAELAQTSRQMETRSKALTVTKPARIVEKIPAKKKEPEDFIRSNSLAFFAQSQSGISKRGKSPPKSSMIKKLKQF